MRGPSRTAEYVCFLRALEARRPSPIVFDPHAERFLRPSVRPLLAQARPHPRLDGWPGIGTYVITRHRWIDDRLAEAIADGVQEVMVLGAGYDSRALRFPGPRYWEVDHPATAARKREVAPDHPVQRVDVDFTHEALADRLVAAGFPVGARCFVIWEGVTMYLNGPAVRATLRVLRSMVGHGSALALDGMATPARPTLAHRAAVALMPLIGEPLTFDLGLDDLSALLHAEGWQLEHSATDGALRAQLAPRRVIWPGTWVALATRG